MSNAKPEPADLVIKSSKIYTVAREDFLDGALAIGGNLIVAGGRRADVESLSGAKTRVLDLGDKMIMPGFIEGHTHIDGTLIKNSRVALDGVGSQEECVNLNKNRIGSMVSAGTFPIGKTMPTPLKKPSTRSCRINPSRS